MLKVHSDELLDSIQDLLEAYQAQAIDTVEEIIPEVADTCLKMIRGNSRVSNRRTRKHYAKGWKKKRTKANRYVHVYTIYNDTKPGLTQLLEKGYTRRNGKRVEGDGVIGDAEEYAISILYNQLMARLKG